MFNRGKFNRAKYNVNAPLNPDVTVSARIPGTVGGLVAPRSDVYTACSAVITAGGRVSGCPAELAEGGITFGISGGAAHYALYYCNAGVSSGVLGAAYPYADVYGGASIGGGAGGRSYMGADVFALARLEARAAGRSFGGRDYYGGGAALYAIMDGQSSAIRLDMVCLDVAVTIPPGGVLVIDSEHYTVLLDGVNVIERHTGGWVDVSRNTYDIQADTGTAGERAVSLLYTERYL